MKKEVDTIDDTVSYVLDDLEPIINDNAVLESYSYINAVSNENTRSSLIDLPVISTENGPFRLVNNAKIMC